MSLHKGSNRLSHSQRQSVKELEKLGFRTAGFKANSHLVMMHRELGRLDVPTGTPAKIVVDLARRKAKLATSNANEVLTRIEAMYGVPPDGEKVIERPLSRMIDEACDQLGGKFKTASQNALLESIRKNPRIEILKKSNGRNPGLVKIRGLYYMAPDEQEPVPDQEPTVTTVVSNYPNAKIDPIRAQLMLNQGMSVKDIAKEFGCKIDAIYKRISTGSLTRPGGKRASSKKLGRKISVDLVAIQNHLNLGDNPNQVAKDLGYSNQTIYRHLKSGRLTMPSPGIKVVEGEVDGVRGLGTAAGEFQVPENFDDPMEISADVKQAHAESRHLLKDLVQQPSGKTETAIPHEGLTVLGEYLKAMNEVGEAKARVDLMKGGLDDLQRLYAERDSLLRLLADIDVKIVQELDTLRNL